MGNFEYKSEFNYWRSYIPAATGLIIGYFIFSGHCEAPVVSIGFALVVVLVMIDVAFAGFLRLRAPRSFKVKDSTLQVCWRQRNASFPIESIGVRKGFRWIFNSATVLQTDGESFFVFNDLDNFSNFISIFDEPRGS